MAGKRNSPNGERLKQKYQAMYGRMDIMPAIATIDLNFEKFLGPYLYFNAGHFGMSEIIKSTWH